MKNSMRLAMYTVTFKSGVKVSVMSKQADAISDAIGKHQVEGLLDVVSLEREWFL